MHNIYGIREDVQSIDKDQHHIEYSIAAVAAAFVTIWTTDNTYNFSILSEPGFFRFYSIIRHNALWCTIFETLIKSIALVHLIICNRHRQKYI